MTADASSAPRDGLLVALFLAGPALFAADMALSYFLVPHALHTHRKSALHLIAATAFVAVVATTLWSARALRSLPRAADDDGAAERRRFLAAGGAALGAYSLMLIVANEIGKVVHDLRD